MDHEDLIEQEVEAMREHITESPAYDPTVPRDVSRRFLRAVAQECRDLIAALDEDDERDRGEA